MRREATSRPGRFRPAVERQHTSAYVSIRQHKSAYVSIRRMVKQRAFQVVFVELITAGTQFTGFPSTVQKYKY
jgi:hypothetical protein